MSLGADAWEVTGRDRIQADQLHFVFFLSSNSRRLPIGVSGDTETNENAVFPTFLSCSFNCGCTLNLAIWQAETRPLLMHPIMCRYRFQISWFCPVDRRGVHGLALAGDVNVSIIFSLIKSSATAQAGAVIFFWRNIPLLMPSHI